MENYEKDIMNKKIVLILLLILAACSTPSEPSEVINGQRNVTYETALFENLTYTLTKKGETLTYNVSILTKTGFISATAQHTLQNNTLTLLIKDAQTDPRVKEALYTTTVTGTIKTRQMPKQIQIINEAGPQNNTIII